MVEAQSRYSSQVTLPAAWTRSTAGGSSDSPHYLINPQFTLSVKREQNVAFLLQLPPTVDEEDRVRDIHVKMLVSRNDGNRITKLRMRDTVAHSGDYQRLSAVIETKLSKGEYAVICSTFDQNQYAKFTLDVLTSEQGTTTIRPLPAESSGRYKVDSSLAHFPNGTNRLLAPITLSQVTRAIFIAHQARASPASSLFKMTLEKGQGPYKTVIAASANDLGEFAAVQSGLRIGDTNLHPSLHGPGTGGLWLVLERLASDQNTPDEQLVIEMLVDERFDLGPSGLGSG